MNQSSVPGLPGVWRCAVPKGTDSWLRDTDKNVGPDLPFLFKCTEFDQLILRKIIKIVATRCQILRLKCTKFDFVWNPAPDPAGGAYNAPSDFLGSLREPTSKGREKREGERKGMGRRKRRGRRRERDGMRRQYRVVDLKHGGVGAEEHCQLLIAYFLSNISVKYYQNPTMLSRVIAKNIGDVFL